MPNNKVHVEIYTPLKKYLAIDVDLVSIQSENYRLGILPKHAEMVTNIAISRLTLKDEKDVFDFAVGEGIAHVLNDKTIILVDTIEAKEEIDVPRAERAREEAEKLLASNDPTIDKEKVAKDLLKAKNRLKVATE